MTLKKPQHSIAQYALSATYVCALVASVFFMASAIILLIGSFAAPSGHQQLASAGGACAAGAGVFFAAWQFGQQDISRRSKLALDTAIQGVERAYQIIDKYPPATRIQWINAGRVMTRAMRTSRSILLSDHRAAWDQFREEWIIKFYPFLSRSPEFYMGLPEPADFDPLTMVYPDTKIIDLLRQTKIKQRFSMKGLSSSGTSNSYLSVASIKAIYDFAQYDDEWNDPLDDLSRFSDEEFDKLKHRDSPGLYVFLYAMRKFFTLGSTVREYSKLGTEGESEIVED